MPITDFAMLKGMVVSKTGVALFKGLSDDDDARNGLRLVSARNGHEIAVINGNDEITDNIDVGLVGIFLTHVMEEKEYKSVRKLTTEEFDDADKIVRKQGSNSHYFSNIRQGDDRTNNSPEWTPITHTNIPMLEELIETETGVALFSSLEEKPLRLMNLKNEIVVINGNDEIIDDFAVGLVGRFLLEVIEEKKYEFVRKLTAEEIEDAREIVRKTESNSHYFSMINQLMGVSNMSLETHSRTADGIPEAAGLVVDLNRSVQSDRPPRTEWSPRRSERMMTETGVQTVPGTPRTTRFDGNIMNIRGGLKTAPTTPQKIALFKYDPSRVEQSPRPSSICNEQDGIPEAGEAGGVVVDMDCSYGVQSEQGPRRNAWGLSVSPRRVSVPGARTAPSTPQRRFIVTIRDSPSEATGVKGFLGHSSINADEEGMEPESRTPRTVRSQRPIAGASYTWSPSRVIEGPKTAPVTPQRHGGPSVSDETDSVSSPITPTYAVSELRPAHARDWLKFSPEDPENIQSSAQKPAVGSVIVAPSTKLDPANSSRAFRAQSEQLQREMVSIGPSRMVWSAPGTPQRRRRSAPVTSGTKDDGTQSPQAAPALNRRVDRPRKNSHAPSPLKLVAQPNIFFDTSSVPAERDQDIIKSYWTEDVQGPRNVYSSPSRKVSNSAPCSPRNKDTLPGRRISDSAGAPARMAVRSAPVSTAPSPGRNPDPVVSTCGSVKLTGTLAPPNTPECRPEHCSPLRVQDISLESAQAQHPPALSPSPSSVAVQDTSLQSAHTQFPPTLPNLFSPVGFGTTPVSASHSAPAPLWECDADVVKDQLGRLTLGPAAAPGISTNVSQQEINGEGTERALFHPLIGMKGGESASSGSHTTGQHPVSPPHLLDPEMTPPLPQPPSTERLCQTPSGGRRSNSEDSGIAPSNRGHWGEEPWERSQTG